MSAQANPKLALRPYLPADAPLLAEIFRASIEELTAEDYSEAQRRRLGGRRRRRGGVRRRGWRKQLTLVATLGGSPVGFVVAQGHRASSIMLYVHPAVAGQGDRRHAVRCGREAGGRARHAAADRRCQRHRARLLRASRLRAAAPQHRSARRRMARHHHDGKAADAERKHAMSKPDTPFPRHWLYYIALKYAVIVAAVLLALYVAYRVS